MPSKAKRAQPVITAPLKSKPKVATKKKVESLRSSPESQGKSSRSRIQGMGKMASPKKTKPSTRAGQQAVSQHDLHVGDLAPAFSLPDHTGRMVNLSELRGKKVVVYFYPKDDTPGCTTEACSFRDGIQDLRKKGAMVFGVSADSVSSHRKFSEKFQLNFSLLSDESKSMIHAYGVWKEKTLYGRKYMGIERTTFVINEDGIIRKIFPKVKVNGHFTEVLQSLG